MEPGVAKVGEYFYYVAFDHPSPGQPAAKLHHVKIEEITYRGTLHETLSGSTYDAETNKSMVHIVPVEEACGVKGDALDRARLSLFAQMENLQKKASCLGFHLG